MSLLSNGNPASNDVQPDARKAECLKCMVKVEHFLTTYGYIMGKDTKGKETGKIPFDLFAYQRESLDLYLKEDYVIILKARQTGLSWTTAGYALWLAMFHKYQRILIISVNDKEAQVFLEKVKFIFDNLPGWMKPSVYKRNETVLWFGKRLGYDTDEVGGINSKIESIPTSKTAGTSRSLNLLIVDEAAKVEFMQAIWKSAQPALSTIKGKCVLLSTMTIESTGEFYEEIWNEAKKGENNFHTFFIPYNRYPGHTEEWLKAQLRNMPASQRALAKQEYPKTEEEAFQSIGGKYYDPQVLLTHYKPMLKPARRTGYLAKTEKDVVFRDDSEGSVHVWQEPELGEQYIVGGDVAEGVEQDSSALTVVRKRDLFVCARFKSNTTDPEVLAHIASKLGQWYNWALVAVENNNHGSACNVVLKDLYHNLYYHEIMDKDEGKPTTRWGWKTGDPNRTWILDYLGNCLDRCAVGFYDKELYQEIFDFVVDPRTGRGDHKKGKHDDILFSLAIALWVIKENPYYDRRKAAEAKAKLKLKRPHGGY
jgi:hypothetical protein